MGILKVNVKNPEIQTRFMIEITFLGTATTMPSKDRNTTSIHIKFRDNRILLDCGEGTQRQMMKANLSPFKLNAIFVTHLHADHLLGLGGIIQTLAFMKRENELTVVGPPKIKKYVNFFKNWDYFECMYPIKSKEIRKEGIVHEDADYMITAFRADHGCPAFGFVFEENKEVNLDIKKLRKLGLENTPVCARLKREGEIRWRGKTVRLGDVARPQQPGRKIVFTGDTRSTRNIVKFARNADILICDGTFGDDMKAKAREYGHMTVKDAARIAKEAGVKQLILTHFSPRYTDIKVLEREARSIFKNSVCAEDLMTLSI
jgi:ribonuclease Z